MPWFYTPIEPTYNYYINVIISLFTERLNVLYERNWTRLVHEQLRKFESSIVAAARQSSENQPNELTLDSKWSFSGALIYSITLITTIGKKFLFSSTLQGCSNYILSLYYFENQFKCPAKNKQLKILSGGTLPWNIFLLLSLSLPCP